MGFFRLAGLWIARFCMSSIFLASGMHKILHWDEVEKNFIDILFEWQGYIIFSDSIVELCSMAIGWAPFLLGATVLLEFIGGLLLLLGTYQKWGATLLLFVLLPTTILMHPFWAFEGTAKDLETLLFMKNLAILGGLVYFLLGGASVQKSSLPAKMRIDRL